MSLLKYRINFDLAVGPFADYLNQSGDLRFLETDITLGMGSNTKLTIRDFISKYESPSSFSIRYIFKADFYGFYSKNMGFMREVCLLDNTQYKKMSSYNAFDNFDISDEIDTIPDDILSKIVYPPKCYHCNVKDFMTKDQYERHVVVHHRNLPGYPGPPDLEKLGLIPQGMSWEKELPRKLYFDFELESKKELQNPRR